MYLLTDTLLKVDGYSYVYMGSILPRTSKVHILFAIFSVVVFFGTCLISVSSQMVPVPQVLKEGTWLYVGGSGLGNYSKIQDAIDNASEGDTVFVYSGWYSEDILINKSINVTGQEKDTTIISGDNGSEIIKIRDCQVELSGFTIQQYNGSNIIGMEMIGCWSSTIHDIIIKSCNIGMLISDTESSSISHNTILNCFNGMYLGIIGNVTISWNRIQGNGNGSGIEFFLSTLFKNYLTRNSIMNYTLGMYLGIANWVAIKENNFIGNQQAAFFTASFFNLWDRNYWGKPSQLPKIIPGRLGLRGIIPFINFDWHPAQEPYDI